MDLSAKPRHNPAVLARKVFEDEMVLVNADNAASLALTNQTAVLVWEMVNGKNCVSDIINCVKTQYKDVPAEMVDDVQNLLSLLAQDGFIGFESVTIS